MAYTIMINEYQRELIQEAIAAYIEHNDTFLRERIFPELYKGHTNAASELELLHSMFNDLPEQEAECPGVLHGFCL